MIPFRKMNGSGNDFVILDARSQALTLTPAQAMRLSARDHAATRGCDQVIVLEASRRGDVFMRIYNADGSESSACGNATRCVAWLIEQETGRSGITVETQAGLLPCRVDERVVSVDMGAPKFGWRDIPLAQECDTNRLPIEAGPLAGPAAVSMGNPHMVFVVTKAAEAPVEALGRELEHHPFYPERANVGFAEIISPREITLRVWERGSGETLACGTGACAAVAALHRRGLIGRDVKVHLKGGDLGIAWDEASNHIWMAGPVEPEFEGRADV